MCNISVIMSFIDSFESDEFINKKILEVGSRYFNGSVRPIIEKLLKPVEYIGIDVERGKYVDKILPAENILDHFEENSFDISYPFNPPEDSMPPGNDSVTVQVVGCSVSLDIITGFTLYILQIPVHPLVNNQIIE